MQRRPTVVWFKEGCSLVVEDDDCGFGHTKEGGSTIIDCYHEPIETMNKEVEFIVIDKILSIGEEGC